MRGYSDVRYSKSSQDSAEESNGTFSLGQFDLYISELLTDRIELLSEFVIEGTPEGEFVVDLERLQIGYIFNDALKLRAGRFHNVLGYWNLAYHHGEQIQTGIGRPSFLRFEDEGGLLPVHLVGLWVGGRFKTAPAVLGYDLMVGNGAKVAGVGPSGGGTLDPNSAADDNKNKAVAFRLQASPRSWPELIFNVSGNFSKVEGYDAALARTLSVEQSIVGLSADRVMTGNGFDLLSEIYWVKDKDKMTGLGSKTNTLYYIQAEYTFMEKWTPYARYEQMLIDEGDPYMTALSAVDTKTSLAGLRYELSINSVLKGETRKVNPKGAEDYYVYAFQWAFAF